MSYAIDPDGAASKVNRFSTWMQTNKIVVVAAIIGVIGVALIGRGISGLG